MFLLIAYGEYCTTIYLSHRLVCRNIDQLCNTHSQNQIDGLWLCRWCIRKHKNNPSQQIVAPIRCLFCCAAHHSYPSKRFVLISSAMILNEVLLMRSLLWVRHHHSWQNCFPRIYPWLLQWFLERSCQNCWAYTISSSKIDKWWVYIHRNILIKSIQVSFKQN